MRVRAQNAQRMLDDESWGLPRLFDDHYDLQKPPCTLADGNCRLVERRHGR